jgi:hypothetical protein
VPCPMDTEVVFFDGWPGHHYLYQQYAEVAKTSLVVADGWQWDNPQRKDIDCLEFSTNRSVRSVVFQTLDPYVYSSGFDRVVEYLKSSHGRVKHFGILHKLPEDDVQREQLHTIAGLMGVILLDEGMRDDLTAIIPGMECFYLPHHPVFAAMLTSREEAKWKLGLSADKAVVSLLGELREGKGVPRLLEALPFIDDDVRSSALFAICGKATDVAPEVIRAAFSKAGVELHLQSQAEAESYKLLPDPVMANYISASDIGLLLYEGPQRECMSGVLPNYLQCDSWIIASHDSKTGGVVEQKQLGSVVNISDPQLLAKEIGRAVRSLGGHTWSEARREYTRSLEGPEVVKELRRILGMSP